MYESDDIIKYLVGKYGVCNYIDLLPLMHFNWLVVFPSSYNWYIFVVYNAIFIDLILFSLGRKEY